MQKTSANLIWLNVDKNKTQRIHYQGSCTNVIEPGTQYKPVNKPGRDGGWFSFHTLDEAIADSSARLKYQAATACHTCIKQSSEFSALVDNSRLIEPPPRFFWVNQGASYKEEREFGIIWAPQLNASGHGLAHWELILQVRPGDIVFSYAKQRIGAVATAVSNGKLVDGKPISSTNWADGPGLQADVLYTTSNTVVTKAQLLASGFFAPGLGDSLIQSDGKLKLVYLQSLTAVEGAFLLHATGFHADATGTVVDPRVAPTRTVRKQLVDARLGQGKFREDLFEAWKSRCPVTAIGHAKLLRASHIKRWADSTNAERLDPFNGILLSAHMDAAFDCGLISFSDQGQILVHEKLAKADREILQLESVKPITFLPKHKPYLAEHRARYGFET